MTPVYFTMKWFWLKWPCEECKFNFNFNPSHYEWTLNVHSPGWHFTRLD